MLAKDLLIEAKNFTQDRFLKMLCTKNTPTKIYLRNGIALQGFIENFDKEVVILKNQASQLVYISSIATIMTTFGININNKTAQKKSST